MIFQFSINLKIKDKVAQAVIDLDTGLIGFIEKSDEDIKEYSFLESPLEFRKAFFEQLEDKTSEAIYLNSLISRKGEVGKLLTDHWKKKKEEREKTNQKAD